MPGPASLLDGFMPQTPTTQAGPQEGATAGQPEVVETPPAETPPEEITPQPPVAEIPGQKPDQPVEGATVEAEGQPGEQAIDEETQASEESDEQSHLFEDFEFQTNDDEPPAVETPAAPAPNPSVDVLAQIGERLGRQINSIDDLFQGDRLIQPSFEGYSPQTSSLIDEALDEGLLDPESIASGKLNMSWAQNRQEDLVYDYLKSGAEASGRDLSDEEIEQRYQDMSDLERDMMARNQAAMMELKAQSALNNIRNAMRADEFARQQQQKALAQEKQTFFSRLQETAASMDKIPGTEVVMDPQMKADVSNVARSIFDLPKDHIFRKLLGNPGNDAKGYEKAITQISRLMYPGKIQQVAASRGKNEGIRQAIQSSTAAPAATPGQPVSDQPPVNRRNQQEAALDGFFGRKAS